MSFFSSLLDVILFFTRGQKLGNWVMHLLHLTHKHEQRTPRRQMKEFIIHGVTIGDLRENIQEIRGIPSSVQIFVSCGEQIGNGDDRFVFNLKSYGELFLYTRSHGNTRTSQMARGEEQQPGHSKRPRSSTTCYANI
jgi:hypothetical protein